jgi:hypothetical protein
MSPDGEGDKPGARSDLAQGVFWLAAGGAIFYGSWTMDRLANLGVKPFSAPGLLPGALGIFIVVLGAAMLVRALRAGALQPQSAAPRKAIEWRRVLLPTTLCVAYAAVLVGHGMPFWLASWIFVAAMIGTLQFHERRERGELRRLALLALTVGAGAGIVVSLIFQEVFLIRLP